MHVLSSFSMQVTFDTLNFSACDAFVYMLMKRLKSYMLFYCLELYECVWVCNICFIAPSFKCCLVFMYIYSYQGLLLVYIVMYLEFFYSLELYECLSFGLLQSVLNVVQFSWADEAYVVMKMLKAYMYFTLFLLPSAVWVSNICPACS